MPIAYLRSRLIDQEKIIYVARQHWFVFVSSIFVEIVITIALAGIALIVNVLIPPTLFYSIIVFLVLLFVPTVGAVRDFLI